MGTQSTAFSKRDVYIIITTAFVAATLMISTSVWGTSIGTDVTVTGDVYATSTVQATGNILGYADMFIGGTSTQALADVAFGGAAGTHADVYVSGGLGVANATTSDGDFIVGGGDLILSYTSNGRLVVGATSTALTATGGTVDKFVFDGGNMRVSSGGSASTTLSIDSEGGGSCIELRQAGTLYRAFVNAAGTGILVEAGACQ